MRSEVALLPVLREEAIQKHIRFDETSACEKQRRYLLEADRLKGGGIRPGGMS
jgi:hypothetical protein